MPDFFKSLGAASLGDVGGHQLSAASGSCLDVDDLSCGVDCRFGGCGRGAGGGIAGLNEAFRVGRVGGGINAVWPGSRMRRVDMLLRIIDIGTVATGEAVYLNRVRE